MGNESRRSSFPVPFSTGHVQGAKRSRVYPTSQRLSPLSRALEGGSLGITDGETSLARQGYGHKFPNIFAFCYITYSVKLT